MRMPPPVAGQFQVHESLWRLKAGLWLTPRSGNGRLFVRILMVWIVCAFAVVNNKYSWVNFKIIRPNESIKQSLQANIDTEA
jgi:hypothetical protein